MADKEEETGGKMWFHPVTGAYVICTTPNEVPEGFVNNLSECSDPVLDKFEGPARCSDFVVTAAATKKPEPKKSGVKKAAPKAKAAKKDKAPAKAKGPTLKSLKITREEATEILNEDKIKFDAEASDDEIATLVEALLEED